MRSQSYGALRGYITPLLFLGPALIFCAIVFHARPDRVQHTAPATVTPPTKTTATTMMMIRAPLSPPPPPPLEATAVGPSVGVSVG